MLAFLYDHLDLVLALLLLVSRLGDLISTYLVTPTLRLEANPIVRRLGWRFAIVSNLAICALPYISREMAVMALMPFLLVCASNSSHIWMARTLGEEEYKALALRVARRSRLSHAVAGTCASGGFFVLTGLVVLLFNPDPSMDWGFWMGAGIVFYGLVVIVYRSLYLRRLFAEAGRGSVAAA